MYLNIQKQNYFLAQFSLLNLLNNRTEIRLVLTCLMWTKHSELTVQFIYRNKKNSVII